MIHLTDDHFDSFRDSHTHMMVMFYAPWCDFRDILAQFAAHFRCHFKVHFGAHFGAHLSGHLSRIFHRHLRAHFRWETGHRCGHCKNLKPDWVEASTQIRKFTFAAMDCTIVSSSSGRPVYILTTPTCLYTTSNAAVACCAREIDLQE